MRTFSNFKLSTFQRCQPYLEGVRANQTPKISSFFQKTYFCERHISETRAARNLKQKPKVAHKCQVLPHKFLEWPNTQSDCPLSSNERKNRHFFWWFLPGYRWFTPIYKIIKNTYLYAKCSTFRDTRDDILYSVIGQLVFEWDPKHYPNLTPFWTFWQEKSPLLVQQQNRIFLTNIFESIIS